MNPHSFALQVSSVSQSLHGLAHRLTQNAEDSRDLIQETIYKAIANHEKFAKGTNLKAWLYTIMRNIFINNYRRHQMRGIVVGSADADVDDRPMSYAFNGGEGRLVQHDIDKALNAIEQSIRVPFLMHYKGFKYEEIAAHLGVPVGTVKSRIFFARKALRDHLRFH